MLDLAPKAIIARQPTDPTVIFERLNSFAHEMESIGLPWAAAHIRNVAGMVAAEHELADAFRN